MDTYKSMVCPFLLIYGIGGDYLNDVIYDAV